MEAYLEKCIQSAVSQTYQNLEIILIDDGSTDLSNEICLAWAKEDSRIIYIRQENKGLGESRNVGIKISSAEYITFLDADDWLEPDFVSEIMEKIVLHDTDIGMSDMYYVDGDTMEKDVSAIRLSDAPVSASIDKSVIVKSRTFACGKIYRKALFNSSDLLYPQFNFEDIPCTPMLVAVAQRVIRVPQPMYNYLRKRKDSLSNDAANIGDIKLALMLLHDRLRNAGLYGDFMLEFKKILIGQIRFACRKWGNLEHAKALRDLASLIEIYLPRSKLLTNKYYAYANDTMLSEALDKAIIFPWQSVGNYAEADVVIAYASIKGTDKQIIQIAHVDIADCDSRVWEMVDEIMEAM
jgi:glycosyltransferase involved in cell wall biosynthesis